MGKIKKGITKAAATALLCGAVLLVLLNHNIPRLSRYIENISTFVTILDKCHAMR